MKTKTTKRRPRIARATEGSGNVFADLGLPNPERELLRAQLTLQIYTILKGSGMTQIESAKILGVHQPQVSLLMRNRAGTSPLTLNGIPHRPPSRRRDYRPGHPQRTWGTLGHLGLTRRHASILFVQLLSSRSRF